MKIRFVPKAISNDCIGMIKVPQKWKAAGRWGESAEHSGFMMKCGCFNIAAVIKSKGSTATY